MSGQSSHVKLPVNIRKPFVFGVFRGYKMETPVINGDVMIEI